MTNDETPDDTITNPTFVIRASSFLLNIEVADIQRVVLDELPARLDHVAHQDGEHLVGFDRVVVVQVDLEQFALLRIHRGVEQLLGVHFAQAFEALDLHAAPSDLDDLSGESPESRRAGCTVAFSPSPSISSKIGLSLRGVVVDLQTFARELRDDLLDRGRFVQLDQFGAAADAAVRFHRRRGERQ